MLFCYLLQNIEDLVVDLKSLVTAAKVYHEAMQSKCQGWAGWFERPQKLRLLIEYMFHPMPVCYCQFHTLGEFYYRWNS